MQTNSSTVDRVVLLSAGGVKEVGFYALANMVIETLRILPKFFSLYVYLWMTFKFGQNKNALELWDFGIKFVFLSIGVTSLAVAPGWMVLPYIVTVAPSYIVRNSCSTNHFGSWYFGRSQYSY